MKLNLVFKSFNKEKGFISFEYYPTNITVKQLSKAIELFASRIKNTLYEDNDLNMLIGHGICVEV